LIFGLLSQYNIDEANDVSRGGAFMILQNRVAVVTGSSRGIGAATAKLLAAHGAKVTVNYHRDHQAGETVLGEIADAGGKAIMVEANVTVREEVDKMVKRTEEELGPIDILVNNANMSFPIKPFTEIPWDGFEKKLLHEMKAAFYCCKAVIPGMIERKRGSIINVSSGLSTVPGLGFSAHTTAKAGLNGFSKALALELGPYGIRVNVVAPGLTITDATAHRPQEMKDAIAARTPLRRIAMPDDVAGAILFFCGDWSRFVSGSYVSTSGGAQMF